MSKPTALVICPHPDDGEMGCGEFCAQAINAGWNVIGWFHDYDTNASSLADNITGCQFISMFDSNSQSFWTYTGNPASDFIITRGMGLMLYTTTSSVWHGEG